MKLRNKIVLGIYLVMKNSLVKQNAHQDMMHCMNISSTYRPKYQHSYGMHDSNVKSTCVCRITNHIDLKLEFFSQNQ